MTRLATDIADQFAEAATQRGMTVSDYLATLVYSELGLPPPQSAQSADQPQLPLSA